MQLLCSARRWLRGPEPRVRAHRNRPWLLRSLPWLAQRELLRFQRQPLARGVAAGMFCVLIPGPLQIPGTLLARTQGGLFRAGGGAVEFTGVKQRLRRAGIGRTAPAFLGKAVSWNRSVRLQ